LGYPVAVLQVNNAGELVQGAFEEYCRKNGITYEKTVPDASQQNDVAERTIQMIECMTHAMLVDANLPHLFWPLAAQAAVHIKNRIPHRSLPPNTTPYEVWFKKQADLSHLRPFGALITCQKMDSDSLNKVTEQGEEGRFMGYARNAKGYLIWFPETQVIHTQCDVVFHGFPSFLPALALSEILWDDIPYDLEPHFGGVFESSDCDKGTLSRVAGKSGTDRTVESSDQDNSPGTGRDEKSKETGHLHSGMLPIQGKEGLIPNSCINSGQPNDPDAMQINDPPPQCRSPRLAQLSAHAFLDDYGTTDEGGTQILMALLNSQIDKIEIECDEPNLTPLLSRFIEAAVAFVGVALTDPIDNMEAKDPRTVQEAKLSIYWSYWLAAIHEELESLKAKGVYNKVSELPPGQKAVDSKWVLHIKRNRDSRILRFKAQLVAKGFTQIPGQDFTYTFTPVAQWESIRLLLAIATSLDMEI
jgi:hypothetical protein